MEEHETRETPAMQDQKLAIQSNFMAAYSNRRPEDIGEEERKDFQAFWNRTPRALADLVRAKLTRNLRMVIKYGMDTTITRFTFNGADLRKAYLQYDAEGKDMVGAALEEPGVVYTREYIKAMYPQPERFLDTLTDCQKNSITAAIKTMAKPQGDIQAFQVFIILYGMADQDIQDLMAEAIDVDEEKIQEYRTKYPAPDRVVFPPNTQAQGTLENVTTAQDINPSEQGDTETQAIIPLELSETMVRTAWSKRADGLEIGCTPFEQQLPRMEYNAKKPTTFCFRGSRITANVTVKRPYPSDDDKDEPSNGKDKTSPIPITAVDQGIVSAVSALNRAGIWVCTEEQIYRQWRQESKADVTPEQKALVSKVLKNAIMTFFELDDPEFIDKAKELNIDLPTFKQWVTAERRKIKIKGGKTKDGKEETVEIDVWVFNRSRLPYLTEFSDELGQRRLIQDTSITDVSGIGSGKNDTHSSSKIELALRDGILRRLEAIDNPSSCRNHKGNVSLFDVLEKGGMNELLEQLQERGRGHSSAYRRRKKWISWMENYLEQLKKVGRIEDYSQEQPGSYTVTTIPTDKTKTKRRKK